MVARRAERQDLRLADVGYQALSSGFQDVVAPLFQLALLVFSVGVLVVGLRHGNPVVEAAADPSV